MVKIVVVGQKQSRILSLKKSLSELRQIYKNVAITSAHPSYLESALDEKLTLMVVDLGRINRMLFAFVDQIRKCGFEGPIIALGELGESVTAAEVAKHKRLFALRKPFADGELLGLCKNCLNVESMRQRRDQRFDVNERAIIESYNTEFRGETTINNISRSGLRVKGNLAGLKQGDLLRLQFRFEEIQKERVMSARVVWLKKVGDSSEEAGLEFVSQKAVYQYLLDNAAA